MRANAERTNLLPCDGEMYFFPDAITPDLAAELFEELKEKIAFTQEEGVIYGRRQFFPRETAWFGDGSYKHSGFVYPPAPMPDCLLPLKALAEVLANYRFNSVLLNHYRNGRDSVSWHSDDETKSGLGSVIASLSFGYPRRFRLKHRTQPRLRLALDLTGGSYLIMAGTMQQHWQHSVPKVSHAEPRINLTFRRVAVEG